MTKQKIENTKDMIRSAKILLRLGAKNVLLKGGHLANLISQMMCFYPKMKKKSLKTER